uniref:Uncharacterized protein n=1 Tax=Lactuca sativa TaxID=4236 RepID=A0A9R1VIR3_LACSA|nr:hypothetical protein LSAT_V11C500282060 [Lactuca sativa]
MNSHLKIDQTIGLLERMFKSYKQYEDILVFLFTWLQNFHISTINDVDDLFNESELLQKQLIVEHNTANKILNFLKMINIYRYPFLKSYLRWTLSQERLNCLNGFFENIDYESVINEFNSKNARRKYIVMHYFFLKLRVTISFN